jgi:hypothetical protein
MSRGNHDWGKMIVLRPNLPNLDPDRDKSHINDNVYLCSFGTDVSDDATQHGLDRILDVFSSLDHPSCTSSIMMD